MGDTVGGSGSTKLEKKGKDADNGSEDGEIMGDTVGGSGST